MAEDPWGSTPGGEPVRFEEESKEARFQQDWTQTQFRDRPPRRGTRGRGRQPRRPQRGTRGQPRGRLGERAKVLKRRFVQNQHFSEVVYRDEDVQIDPETLSADSHFRADRNWEELLPPDVVAAVEAAEYTYPSKIQNLGIEIILSEPYESLMAQAPNGSGKTATFVLGSLCRIDRSDPSTQVICLNHTLELAKQNFEEYKKFADKLGISVGMISKKESSVENGQVVVTVEGTFLRALRSKQIDISNLKVLVFDEADHLLNSAQNSDNYNKMSMHAQKDFPQNLQFLLFSATFTDAVRDDILRVVNSLNEITIKKEELMLDTITHYYLRCEQEKKIETFHEIVRKITTGICVAFINTCQFANRVNDKMKHEGHKAALLMGRDMTINERTVTMDDFKQGKYTLLVTTNLLARGIDNTKVSCVVNFDLPRKMRSNEIDMELYLHRSGRCSRFGRQGVCINLVTGDQEYQNLMTIQDYYGIEVHEIPSIEELDNIVQSHEEETKEEI